jgi:hypothetical protein
MGGRENDNEKTTLEHPIPVRGTATGHWHCGGKYRYTNTYTRGVYNRTLDCASRIRDAHTEELDTGI